MRGSGLLKTGHGKGSSRKDLVVVLGRNVRLTMTTKSVSQTKRRRDGFTLIELLVVIAIITLLLSVLMPAMRKAKELGKRAVCLNHTRQLTISWSMYADDYSGWIPQVKVGPTGSTDFGWVAAAASNSPEDQIESIEDGVLFPYTATKKVYHCPTSPKDQPRSYSIVSSMNSKGTTSSRGNVYRKIEDIPMASDMFVFVCGGRINTKDNAFHVKHKTAKWGGDRPPLNHANGAVFSYADGHSESLSWQDKVTIEIGKGEESINALLSVNERQDLLRAQKGLWGTPGYSPQDP